MKEEDKIFILENNLGLLDTSYYEEEAIAGSSWVYAYKGEEILSLLLWVSFTVNAFGVFINLTKL